MQLRTVIETILSDEASARLAASVGLGVLVVGFLVMGVIYLKRRRHGPEAGLDVPAVSSFADLGDWGTAVAAGMTRHDEATGLTTDLKLLGQISGTMALAIAAAAAVWLAGLALAPSIAGLVGSAEWRMQPLYIGTHIVTVRLFLLAYMHGFRRGVAHLDVPAAAVSRRLAWLLGWPAVLVAVGLGTPFAISDFASQLEPGYTHIDGGQGRAPIDYLLAAIWLVEWVLNAYIWVLLVGFLVLCRWVIRGYPFRDRIEIVLFGRYYRPFLQMSAQGASVLLVFTAVTVFYIWTTGGELTDYIGLGVTAVLLATGFFATWGLLKAKVRQAVAEETLAMRRRLVSKLEQADATAPEAGDLKSLESRLDAAVAFLRIDYLEGRHNSLGQTEAKAVLVRMLAPAASIGWQASKSSSQILGWLHDVLPRLF